ncbi:hypothetical protein CYMTET_10780 [Cymbomonas tetramitiformis]|uniref:Patatin n=1 Tax=Cymbomonas tetramitiformis TaxID=36881 RepID=A0AAE0GNX8_9CHLO|nr:hypothetical protein CYMTET_10780 [Cymbomonas tetramitiformis]
MRDNKWPELERENIATKPSVGLAFSGGGSRSFIASLGYLRGLVDLGLLNKARYITGVSGGSWAVSTLAYYKRGGTGQAKNDAELLGDVVAPESITWQGLSEMPTTCARKVVQKSIYAAALKLYLTPNYPRDTVWQETIQEIFMEPVGITNEPFSLDQASVLALKARNPALLNTTFITTNDVDHPYPIIPVTVLGPTKLIPYEERNRTYTHVEITPLYVGEPCEKQVTFCSKKGVDTRLLGGLVEPFAFKSQPPAQGLAPSAASGSLQVAHPPSACAFPVAGTCTSALRLRASQRLAPAHPPSACALPSGWHLHIRPPPERFPAAGTCTSALRLLFPAAGTCTSALRLRVVLSVRLSRAPIGRAGSGSLKQE